MRRIRQKSGNKAGTKIKRCEEKEKTTQSAGTNRNPLPPGLE